jgi:hypothetical protein
MTKEKLNIYREALVAVYEMLDIKHFKQVKTRAFTTKYGISQYFFKALELLGYVEAQYKTQKQVLFIKTNKTIDPIDARKIIDYCNQLAKHTIIKSIKLFNDEYENLQASTIRKVYRNKYDHKQIINNLEQAIQQGVNLADFEIHTITRSPKATFLQKHLGKEYVHETDIEYVSKFLKTLKKLAGNSEFQKQLTSLSNKIINSKDVVRTANLRRERVELYIKHKIIPRANFKDLNLYYKIKKDG